MVIYWFSGSGNSLFVARELQRRLPGVRLVAALQALRNEEPGAREEAVGFVFPVYLSTLPRPVRSLLERIDLRTASYVFGVATRIGTPTIVEPLMRRLVRTAGATLNATFLVNMASSTPTGLVPGKGNPRWVERSSGSHLAAIEARVTEQLEQIAGCVGRRESVTVTHPLNPLRIFRPVLVPLLDGIGRNSTEEIPYLADKSCTGCGVCERVCPSGKVKVVNARPQWDPGVACFYCYACFNFCPTRSILVANKWERKDHRYHHPEVAAGDIAAQKPVDGR